MKKQSLGLHIQKRFCNYHIYHIKSLQTTDQENQQLQQIR